MLQSRQGRESRDTVRGEGRICYHQSRNTHMWAHLSCDNLMDLSDEKKTVFTERQFSVVLPVSTFFFFFSVSEDHPINPVLMKCLQEPIQNC